MSEKQNAKASKLARQIKENPDDSFSKFALALEVLKKRKLDKAQVLFEDILNRDPEYLGVYYHLGKLYENEKGNLKRAKKLYKKGISIAEKQGKSRTEAELREAIKNVNTKLNKS